MTSKPDPRSGLDVDGNWTPAFPGQRPPFEPGHELGGRPVEHGAYSVLTLSPRAEAIAAWIRSQADHLTLYDEAEVQRAALVLAQLERAAGFLGEVDEAIIRGDDVDGYLQRAERRGSLSKDARGWAAEGRRTLDGLGLTPTGRAQLEAAQQPQGYSHEEVREMFVALFTAANEYIDRARRQEFDTRVKAIIGELPAAGETTESET